MKKTATIKILNETECAIIGLQKEEYKYLSDKFGFFVKGYFFNPLYKLNKWDGKKYYFTESGLTYVKILDEVLPLIKDMGYKFSVIDKRKSFDLTIPKIDENIFKDYGITLGKHQYESVNSVIDNTGGIIIGGTGAGKSLICAALSKVINDQNLKVIVIVPTSDLIGQTRAEFYSVGINSGEYSGKNKDINHPTVVSTWQALQNNMVIMKSFDAVIVDECHGVAGNTLTKILNEYGKHIVLRIGVTGTLPKDKCDAMAVKICLGVPVYEIPAAKLIEVGWLADLKIECHILNENMQTYWDSYQVEYPEESKNINYEQFKMGYFPDYQSEKDFLTKHKNRKSFIAAFIDQLRIGEKSNTFVLVNSLTVGKSLQKLIPNSIFVHGGDDSSLRKKIYDSFDNNDDVVVIATYHLASTGLNIKRIFNLVLVDPNKSFIQVIQSIGRGLRKAKDKNSVTVYDISTDLKYGSTHRKQRIKYYKEQNYKYSIKKIDYWKVFS
jgi:superfamily II DNA or RNA helicase